MKNKEYRSLRKKLVFFFMSLTILVLGSIFMFVVAIRYYGNLYGSQGLLKENDLLLFYNRHVLECNTFLFVVGIIFLLYLFITIFFKNVNVLLYTLQDPSCKAPLSFCFFKQFTIAKKKVEKMVETRKASQLLAAQEKERKNELLMYLAHDLKTPLTSVIGYINHVLDHNVDEQQEKDSIHIAYEKALRLDQLIDEFSELLRYDEKVSQLNLSNIDIDLMIHQQLTGFYPLLEKKNISIQVDLPSNFYVIGDYDKLLRVFDNLMKNALNYSDEHSQIRIDGAILKNSIIIHCSNQTENIDQDSLKHLFDKFYRASTARTTTSGGAGLGLAIAKEIISLHRGSIEASQEGNRIVFTIELPIHLEGL